MSLLVGSDVLSCPLLNRSPFVNVRQQQTRHGRAPGPQPQTHPLATNPGLAQPLQQQGVQVWQPQQQRQQAPSVGVQPPVGSQLQAQTQQQGQALVRKSKGAHTIGENNVSHVDEKGLTWHA